MEYIGRYFGFMDLPPTEFKSKVIRFFLDFIRHSLSIRVEVKKKSCYFMQRYQMSGPVVPLFSNVRKYASFKVCQDKFSYF